MLTEIVRPLVRTQIRLLANSQATRRTLVNTIVKWLGYLGVYAEVTRLETNSEQIQVSLTVKKPEGCDATDWETILGNLNRSAEEVNPGKLTYAQLPEKQQRKLQRLLAYMIQVGEPGQTVCWEEICPQLQEMDLEETWLQGIRSAIKVPQSIDSLILGLDPDSAAIALEKAVSIAFLDRRINPEEDRTLAALLAAMK
ncbi:hypothetical protein IQ249_13370 [Lusitaniella coriacea LEGE 07157]|uniref:Uncharacterized protein n=1 Tax=Lusitaniella coriacea LEGE 07157 TaxID=945747 RepID=A0A8J7E001_9CYAN|nr:hypothetical protein [Lusitaniella coriacea]MBE9116891.1 hypothetical protein [Lusitaniella coriacea LEGE 07157]